MSKSAKPRNILILLGVLLWSACSTPAPESFTFLGDKHVEFVAPRRVWSRQINEEKVADAQGRERTVVTSIVFGRPEGEQGEITISTGGQVQNKEVDEELVNLLRQRLTERRWQITEFEWIEVDGLKAYTINYQYDQELGRQVHFIKDGYSWSVEMQTPKENFKDSSKTVNQLVETFHFEDAPTAATPAATTAPE